MVILSTSEAISDLLDQRSAIYSDKVRVLRPTVCFSVNRPFTSHRLQCSSCEPCDESCFIDLIYFLCMSQVGAP